MPLKIHLIIISCIIAAVLLAYQAVSYLHTSKTVGKPRSAVQVVRASWGLNCDPETFATSPVRENNLAGPVDALCKGKISCVILNSSEALGFDPAPNCGKQIVVEYRCFTFDRLWKTTIAPGESGTIDCSNVVP